MRKTVVTVVTMLGGAVVILGTASLIALFATKLAVGSSPTAQATPAAQAAAGDGKVGSAGAAGVLRNKPQKAPSAGNEI
ncbi:hypothetical protein LZC95_15270 [Pendulispora brunnea]|uniref:Uncharacterized protein n=1 Tax=Pendulispora brunnea TaxID=2905690 RepID=A0ABZ2KI10_9BACT